MPNSRWLAGLGVFLLAGCGGASVPPGVQALRDQSATVASVAGRIKPGVFLLEVQTYRGQAMQGTALILSADGTALAPFSLKDGKDVKSIRAQIGGKEVEAKLVRSDEHLGMSLVQIPASAGPFTPVPRTAGPLPKPGDWLVVMTSTPKELGGQVLTELSMVRGVWSGETQQLLMDGTMAGNVNVGTVLADLDGSPVAVVSPRGVQAYSDVLSRVESVLLKPAPVEVASKDKPETRPGPGRRTGPTEVGNAYIGVGFQVLNEDYAELEGLPREGVQIHYVLKGSPAEKAGLLAGDLVVKVNDRPLTQTGPVALPTLIRLMDPAVGKDIKLQVLRDKKPQDITCRFEERLEPKEFLAEDLGLQVREITDAVYYSMPDLFCQDGVLVTGVINNSPAQPSPSVSRLAQGQVITELDGHPTPDIQSFISAVEGIRKHKPAVVLAKVRSGVTGGMAAMNMRLEKTVQTGKKGETP